MTEEDLLKYEDYLIKLDDGGGYVVGVIDGLKGLIDSGVEVTVPLTGISDKLFDSDVHKVKPEIIPDTPSAPGLVDANKELKEMCQKVEAEKIYGD